MNPSTHDSVPERKRRPWLVALAIIAVVLAVLPLVLAKTPFRNRILAAIVNSDDVSVTSSDASFGYFSPLSLSGFKIESEDEAAKIEIAHIQAEHSWLGLLMARPELGMFRFQSPHINLLVDPEELKESSATKSSETTESAALPIDLPRLTAKIVDCSIVVRTTESADPPIDLSNIDITLRVERGTNSPILKVDPSTVFDRQRLTPELCGQGLQLIAPLLADEVDAEGEFSLRIDEFQIPIGQEGAALEQSIHIEGELQLHAAQVGLRNTLAKNASDLILQLIGTAAPEKLTVAQDLTVSFEVLDGRIHHRGLALLLPHGESSIELMSSGSVGLDETLDLEVTVKLPAELLGGGLLGRRVEQSPLVLAITGTLDEPKIELTNSGSLIDSIRELLSGETDTNGNAQPDSVTETITGAVGDIIGGLRDAGVQESATEAARSLLPRLRERLRDRRTPAPEATDL